MHSPMLSPGTIRAIRVQKGMSLQTVAEKAGTTKSQIDKLEKGERRLTVDWLLRIAAALGVEASQMLDYAGTPSSPLLEGGGMLRDNVSLSYDASGVPRHHSLPIGIPAAAKALDPLPIYGMVDAITGTLQHMREAVSYIPRPSALVSSRQAFAVYCPDNRLEPRYTPGDLLFVNAARPVTPGCFVCAIMKNDSAVLGQFLHRDAHTITLNQLNPLQPIQIDAGEIRQLGRIVGSMESA